MCLQDVLPGSMWKQGGGMESGVGRFCCSTFDVSFTSLAFHWVHQCWTKKYLGQSGTNYYVVLNVIFTMCDYTPCLSANPSRLLSIYQFSGNISGLCMGPELACYVYMACLALRMLLTDHILSLPSCRSGLTSLFCPGFHGLHYVDYRQQPSHSIFKVVLWII